MNTYLCADVLRQGKVLPHRQFLALAVAAIIFVCGHSLLAAQTPWLEITPNQENGVYQTESKGRTSRTPVIATFTLKAVGATPPTGKLDYRFLWNSVKELHKGQVTMKNGTAEVSRELVEPGCLILEVTSGDQKAEIGVTCDPFAIEPSRPAPKDFDVFWEKEKAALAKVPMNARLVPVAEPRTVNYGPDVECFDLTLDCTGSKPVRGYYARPKKARSRSLPAFLSLHSAGVRDSNLQAAWHRAKLNHIALDINAHGLPNGKPNEFYSSQLAGPLSGYSSRGIESRDTFYFKGMYLRIVRAIDFLTAQPEWNGEVLIAAGSSQGGGQSLVAGGIDPRVTEIRAAVPAFCDFTGGEVGRQPGWPGWIAKTEKARDTVSYYDACHFAAHFKGKADIVVGLVDHTCPPTGILAAFNQLAGEKSIVIQPTRGHGANALSKKRGKDPAFRHSP